MLAAFALENHACFRDRQELSLHATPRASEIHAFDTGCPQAPRLNRVTAIYGPNGTGKSRLVQALMIVRELVLRSAHDRQDGDALPHTPFLFDRDTPERPSIFETSFIEAGTYYEYRFSHDRERIHEESLFGWPPGGRRRLLLNRRWNPDDGDYDWAFGHSVPGPKQVWRRSTRANALLVSVAAQLNSPTFGPVVAWFRRLDDFTTDSFPDRFTAEAILQGEDRKQRVLDLLRDSDLCVADLSTEKQARNLDSLKWDLSSGMLEDPFPSGAQSVDSFHTRFGHSISGTNRLRWVDLKDESEGARRLFALAWPLIEAVEQDRILVIDGLDRNLHPLLLESLVRRLNSPDEDSSSPSHRAQLVATIHDTSLLADALSRGQVWFTDRDRPSEAVTLTPLSDYRPRKGEALEHGYLAGRYAAVPVTRALHFA